MCKLIIVVMNGITKHVGIIWLWKIPKLYGHTIQRQVINKLYRWIWTEFSNTRIVTRTLWNVLDATNAETSLDMFQACLSEGYFLRTSKNFWVLKNYRFADHCLTKFGCSNSK